MSVYVDDSRNQFRHMRMCHMTADNLSELHAMAYVIGLKRKWFQAKSHLPRLYGRTCWLR